VNKYEDREGLVYARVSSKKQEREGSGLESQEARCINKLRELKLPYTKSFQDSFSGGGDFMNRPAMRELLSYADSRPHQKFLVVFDDLKRFARDVEFHIKLRAEFRARDIELLCLNYNFDESEEGEFTEIIFAAHAQLERRQNQRQVIQKMKARLELGYWPFAHKKGYDMVKDPLHGKIAVPNKEGLKILKPALEAFARGDFSNRIDFSRHLVEKGYWKKRSAEKYLDQAKVTLSDPFYAGFVERPEWNVSRRKGRHEPLISITVYEKIQNRLKKPATTSRLRKDITNDFPVRGLVNCVCGMHMTAAKSKSRSGKYYGYYFCTNLECEHYKKSVPKKLIENGFTNLLKKTKLKDETAKVMKVIFDKVWKEEVSILEHSESTKIKEIEKLDQDIREITNLVRRAKNDHVRSIYEKQIENIALQIEYSQSKIKPANDLLVPYRTALGKATGLLKNPYSIWKTMGIEEQHDLFFFIYDSKLIYHPKEGYRTAKTSTAARLFEDFAAANSDDVDRTGFEPATLSLQMRCSTN
jgi:site-specific DNA recombinase